MMTKTTGSFLRRFLSFMAALVFLLPACPAAAEDEAPAVYSYDFDFRFSMNADAFPARIRAHMQGYADLVNMLRCRGNLTWCPKYNSLNLNAELVPSSNPDAAVSFRLYGLPEHICVSSPLLGNETIWFHNVALMEFSSKAWNNLHIPLQYLSLLYPFATENAFSGLSEAWSEQVKSSRKSRTVSQKTLKKVAEAWNTVIQDDSRLKSWITAVSQPSDTASVLETEFYRLPDYLLNQVARGGKLKVTVKNNTETWTNSKKETLFTGTSDESVSQWSLTLPATESGYLPSLSCSSRTENDLFSLSLDGSYRLASIDADPAVSGLPESLIDIALKMDSWPARLPMDAAFSASLATGGVLYPNLDITLRGESASDGKISVTLSRPVVENGDPVDFISFTGTIIPVAASETPRYRIKDLIGYLPVFAVNDQTVDTFVHKIRKPLFMGILNFLNEIPARACQSIMDDLEDAGVLDMLMVD